MEGAVDTPRSRQAGQYSNHGLGMAGDLAQVLTMPNDPKTSFKGKLTSRKRCVWADPLSLSEVKHVGKGAWLHH